MKGHLFAIQAIKNLLQKADKIELRWWPDLGDGTGLNSFWDGWGVGTVPIFSRELG